MIVTNENAKTYNLKVLDKNDTPNMLKYKTNYD